MNFRHRAFTGLEKRLLDELCARMSARASQLLTKQLDSITLVQRHSKSKEVCCYPMRWGKVHRRPDLRFPARELELKFATITFSCFNATELWTAEFFLVEGYFFCIVFDCSPEGFRHIDGICFQRIEIHRDPMQPSEQPPHSQDTTLGQIDLPEWLHPFLVRNEISNVSPPLESSEREQILRRIDAVLPSDYLELAQHCDGLQVRDWSILGPSEVYDVALPQGRHYVVASCDGQGALAVRAQTHDDPLLYFFDYDSGEPIAVGTSLGTALTQATGHESS